MLSTRPPAIPKRSLHRLPIFPLPNTVLIPQGLLPLHVFEPRYRALVRDVLAGDRLLLIAMLAEPEQPPPARPAVLPVAAIGSIEHHQRFDDGRSLIVVRGLLRAEIVGELALDMPYRIARVRPLADSSAPPKEFGLEDLALLKRLVIELAARVPYGNLLSDACAGAQTATEVADLVAAALISEPDQRQRFLAERDPARRVNLATDAASLLLSRIAELDHAPAN